MSSCDSSFVDDSSSDEEFDLNKEENIAMHKGKKPTHGGSIYGRAFNRRERIDAHKKLIMHNMIIENERRKGLDYTFYHLMGICVMPMRREERIKRFMKVYNEIRDSDAHDQLRKDLMEGYWKWHDERDA